MKKRNQNCRSVFQVSWKLFLCWSFWVGPLFGAEIPEPAKFFGFEPGTSYKLFQYNSLIHYLQVVAGESDRVQLEFPGQSTEGRPFALVTISSPKNLQALDNLQSIQRQLADPRKINRAGVKSLLQAGKVIISINCGIHANEIGTPQMVPRLVYYLATSDAPAVHSVLDSVIILLLPSQNPDGMVKIVDWYNQHARTKFDGCRLPFLYHRYAGHDLNRDWFMFTQQEVRLTVAHVFRPWRPQIVLDMHQMSPYSARQFIPPYIPPIDPFIDPFQLKSLQEIGDQLLNRLIQQGKTGVVKQALFDCWTPARGYPFYYGGLRILSETAGCKLASPMYIQAKQLRAGYHFNPRKKTANYPLPWKGGHWNLEQIVDYELAVALNVLQIAAQNRLHWLQQFYHTCSQAVNSTGKPFALAIPLKQSNPATLRSLIERLLFAGIEIHQTKTRIQASKTKIDSGTYILKFAQPYRPLLNTLFRNSTYPKIFLAPGGPVQRSYDITTHYLPGFLGVRWRQIDEPFQADLECTQSFEVKRGKLIGEDGEWGFLMEYHSNDAVKIINQSLKLEQPVYWSREKIYLADRSFDRGTVIFPQSKMSEQLKLLIFKLGLNLWSIKNPDGIHPFALHSPRIGLYQSWLAPEDEGWIRYLLDLYGFSYQQLNNREIQQDSLSHNFDVIIFPDQTANQIVRGDYWSQIPERYTGGIGRSGLRNLRSFVKQGGTLLLLDSATELAVRYFKLGIKNPLRDLPHRSFEIPGALLRMQLNPQHPVNFGYKSEVPVLFYHSPVFQITNGETVGYYASDSLCVSGFTAGVHYLKDCAACVDIPSGSGSVILFGFRPQFRAQTENTFRLFFNAIFLGAAQTVTFKGETSIDRKY